MGRSILKAGTTTREATDGCGLPLGEAEAPTEGDGAADGELLGVGEGLAMAIDGLASSSAWAAAGSRTVIRPAARKATPPAAMSAGRRRSRKLRMRSMDRGC